MFVAYLFVSRQGMITLGHLLQQRNTHLQCGSPQFCEGQGHIVSITISVAVQ